MKTDTENNNKVIQYFIETSIVGGLAEVPLHPFLTIWTIQQANAEKNLSMKQAIRKIYPLKNYYIGFSATCATALFGTIAYDVTKHAITQYTDNSLLHGFAAYTAGAVFWEPGERVAILAQAKWAKGGQCISSRAIAADILKHDGMRGFYRGSAFGYISNGFLNGVAFFLQDLLKKRYGDDMQQNKKVFVMAGLAGFSLAGLLVTPAEILGTRIRIKKTNFKREIKNIYHTQGMRGFFRGGVTSVLHSAAFSAVSWGPDLVSACFHPKPVA
ncbi:MAG: hypothetical protein A3E84_03530 [Gammaproteobacteria bacterium RIFCSPHIGHO2_12_FULL_42_13]|nr:MAG: hypothetical protein A3E84_03530 [Gammaproteobacteria bacterium RIFCSPHIGHO2_12_FULL_42_13]